MLFLVDQNKSYTYNNLLDDVNKETFYYPYFRTYNIYSFFKNFIIALTRNLPIVLIDEDIKSSQLSIDETLINQTKEISSASFESIYSLIDNVFNSNSDIIIYTSGTTGQPKKVVHKLSSLARSVRNGDRYNNQVWGFAYNPTHMAGTQVFLQAFRNKNTLINIFKLSRKDIYDAIKNYQITHISATSTYYRLLLPFENKFPSITRVTFGGEKSDVKLHQTIASIFPNAKINNIYASTEAGTIFASKGEYFYIPNNIKEKVKIKDDEILLHKSLLGKTDNIKVDEDFYHTGDLIEWLDEEKYLFKFNGRKNELINVGGYKVNPSEVEDALSTIPQIKQSVVYGKSNSVLGTILCADIVLINPIPENEIRMELNKMLQNYKIPRRFKFVEKLELTRTGKAKRL
ncbi:MAG: fatty acid--CoA ligase family protein [Tissierellia bacterium]|nr:fatty acid--CoA ligase family protein [Tissierellia bacterium]MDD4781028.1 fatty acid--CoA ligase family protein [Tissierellia bacterium]